ncbi:cupin domain-containing protein [Brevundimonas sp.]|uniref:cupin domain-containing protein n=1 Tax=Brevundimonas sp. TaxID=1871086 RepID=UPI003D10B56E
MQSIRRIVTGHDANGRAVVVSDALLEGRTNPAGTVGFTQLWTTSGHPIDNDDPMDGGDRSSGLTVAGGSSLRIVELAPAARTPMHRTSSLDYGIVLSGVVDLTDDVSVTRVEQGDIVVKRGTMHGWSNPSADTPARIAFVLLDAIPATVDGVRLLEILPGAAPASNQT